MARILLADDDEFYRTALRGALQGFGHEVVEVGDGRGAQHILALQSFDLLVSDIRMPYLSGVDLLQWAKANTRVPVVLITGFAEIEETRRASELGADGFLLKPFKGEDIESLVKRLTAKEEPAQPKPDVDHLYCKVPLEDFVTGSKIFFSIYVRISSKRYVRIAYQGEDISGDRIEAYKEKGVTYLYLTREDFSKYVNFSLSLLKRLKAAPLIPPERKREFLRYSSEVVLEQVFVEGADRAEFDSAKEFVRSALDLLQDRDEAVALLEALNGHADYLYAHSLGVSLYSSMVARAMKWNSTPVQFKIALAGLLHDVGLKEISRSVLDKPRIAMTQEERSLYESHPHRGRELLSQIPGIPEEVVQIASHHHEGCDGMGYPRKLSRSKIHPLARLVAVTDLFCEYALASPAREGTSALQAIAQMQQAHHSALDPEFFPALKRAFRFDALAEATQARAGEFKPPGA
jgi:response regulator RpfG family c-di-GMP phosphodiesterase